MAAINIAVPIFTASGTTRSDQATAQIQRLIPDGPYLPAYSPDFNPIELAFAKLKALLRSAAARTIPDLWDATRRSLDRFSPAECRAYLAAAGYDAT